MQNIGNLKVSMNKIEKTEDSTVLSAKFIVHGFEVSHNKQLISKEVCKANMHTLVNKPIVCQYIDKDDNYGIDGLTDHAESIGINRNSDEIMPTTDTVAIGVITDADIESIDGVEYLVANAQLWAGKYYNCCSLLSEWYNDGISIPTSVEYFFFDYNVRDGVQEITNNYIYQALCILNAEQRGDLPKVAPAYDESMLISFNQALNSDIANVSNNNKESEGDKMLDPNQVEPIVEPKQDEPQVEPVVVTEPVVEPTVEPQQDEPQVEQSELEIKVNDLTEKVNTLTSEIETLKNEKVALNEELTKATDVATSLNQKIAEMQPIVDEHNKIQFEIALNGVTEKYKAKFERINAIETFNSEEVQGLLKESLNSQEAVNKLNSIIIESIVCPTQDETIIREPIKSTNNLVNKAKTYADVYGFDVK